MSTDTQHEHVESSVKVLYQDDHGHYQYENIDENHYVIDELFKSLEFAANHPYSPIVPNTQEN